MDVLQTPGFQHCLFEGLFDDDDRGSDGFLLIPRIPGKIAEKGYKKKIKIQLLTNVLIGSLVGIIIIVLIINYFQPISEYFYPENSSKKKLAILPFTGFNNSNGEGELELVLLEISQVKCQTADFHPNHL